ncbi:agmatine deiminase [Thioclava dalianensis]|uniref:Agmatine deiminase n=1 Tax=Thioclava dalianensis TaxID=1185766 RepID=A0A074TAY6_9RHOB|nr:agmatine deiminase family protein [Thioclava dalianensis]KEP68956.1 agmatine deiminase [Thioclava dalianensis]SFN73755.1 agmatine deiminase [Thioclava dalianensis]
MTWTMPPETAPQERIWMAFPCEGETLGETSEQREAGYAVWAEVANTIARFQPVTMIVDPSAMAQARRRLDSQIELVERSVGEFWMRDSGPTFVHDAQGQLAAVDWIFNGWGGHAWANAGPDRDTARFIADLVGAPVIPSLLVNEGGGIHVDGAGTVLLTETVQLDPNRNPHADRQRVEAEMARVLGTHNAVWLSRGLSRDYDEFGTSGHVDIVATSPAPGKLLMHAQTNPEHPDFEVSATLRRELSEAVDANGKPFEIIELPAPEVLRDAHGFVDYSYVNHLVINDAVIACGFGEHRADARAAQSLAGVYGDREIVTLDARELFARGGGIHCITQQQPKAGA